MADVPSARKYGFRLTLHETEMSEILNSGDVKQLLRETAADVQTAVEQHVRATTDTENAENYAASLVSEMSTAEALGFNFGGPYGLGDRPMATLGIPAGRGPNPSAKPPLMVEAQTHALTSVPGFTVDGAGEDIR